MAEQVAPPTPAEIEKRAAQFREERGKLRRELEKVIVGHDEILDGVLAALFAGGHVLLEGVPGLGKTLLVRTLSEALSLKFSRIQFTPDLMPADILGTNIVVESEGGGREFRFQKGPIFAQMVLADEVNRATPKTQSALLEAMQERSVTAGGEIRRLDEPFVVIATQNPIDMEGTYPLPEAQLDRFIFKLLVRYSSRADLSTILDRTTEAKDARPEKVMDGSKIMEWRKFIREVYVAAHVKDYAVRLVLGTHPKGGYCPPEVDRFVRFGASPRGAQSLILAAKVRALLGGRYNASFEDVALSALPALRHRLILGFEADAEGITADDIVKKILEKTPTLVDDVPAAKG
ncbi:MAG TPA: MoxR family ATPase [Planctomycetota bacterium]|nr:MoxR family ATPase [Planctomycetota bacterium]